MQSMEQVVPASQPLVGSEAFRGVADLPVRIMIDEQGFIRACAPEVRESFGYEAEDLYGQHLGDLVPELGRGATHEGAKIHSRLSFLSRCGMPFRLRLRDGRFVPVDLFLTRVGDDHHSALAVMVKAIGPVG